MAEQLKIPAKILTPFSPLLMEFTIPQPYVDKLNEYGDKISSNVIESKKLDYSDNLVGNVQQEHRIEDHIWQEKISDEIPSFYLWVGRCVNIYIQTVLKRNRYGEVNKANEAEKKIMKEGVEALHVLSSWVVNSVAGDFNPIHQHDGIISAAGWLMMPESIQNDEEKEYAGWIEFMYGENLNLINNKHSVKPEVGQIFMFPSWLRHTVYPFRGNGIRRSISFNVDFRV